MTDTNSLLWGLLFGSIGTGYFIYGKKQQKSVVLMTGIGLCIFPYFVTSMWLMIFIGVALIALPYFIRS